MKLHLDVKFRLRQKTKVRSAKFTVLALVFSLTAFTVPISSWAAQVNHFRFKGLLAIAFFDGVEGCIATSVGVRVTNGTESDGPGKPGQVSEVDVFIERINTCDDILLLSAEGTTTVSASELQIDKKLEFARLSKTMELTDESGNPLNVSVDLTWMATGQPEVTRDRFYIRTAAGITHEQQKGTLRDASAAGTLSSGGTNFLQNLPLSIADIQSVNDGTRDIIKF